jgi:2-polyprenyl-3-methyl-5-hydroxy-6-metoxy-1,4-benzoquinol methylase
VSQQGQTLDYFAKGAADWQSKAEDQSFSIIENRHQAVFAVMKPMAKGRLLDVGCGTGQLAIAGSNAGWTAEGIDFAQEMIYICMKNNAAAKAHATFKCASVFDLPRKDAQYDVISAQGFIEYISLSQLGEFLDFCFGCLKPGGKIALGSRNRLFNLHSLNDFTRIEMALKTSERLLEEACVLQEAASQSDAVIGLSKLAFEYPQPEIHPITGVKVDTRYQFSPADLLGRLSKHGLKTTRIFPVHYHMLPVSMISDPNYRGMHRNFARTAGENFIDQHKMIPFSSSFVIEAEKT